MIFSGHMTQPTVSRPTWKNCSLWLCNVHCWNATQY